MTSEPSITQSAPLHVALIPLCIPCNEMGTAIGPALREVRLVMEAQGVAEAGPWLTRHWRRPTDSFNFDVCVPVDAPVEASGRVRPGELAATRVARAEYRGGYEGLGGAWGRLAGWIENRKEKTRGDFWEVYAVGPGSSPDPAEWRTDLFWALR